MIEDGYSKNLKVFKPNFFAVVFRKNWSMSMSYTRL